VPKGDRRLVWKKHRGRAPQITFRKDEMSLGIILLFILVLMLIGAIPSWPHSRGWGYGPSGVVGLVIAGVVVLLLLGRI
jgi:hypothetical protein